MREQLNVAGNTYDKYTTTNPIEKRMMQGFFDALDRMLADVDPASIVEAGSGEGRIVEHLASKFPEQRIVGFDIAGLQLCTDWKAIDGAMFVGDATSLPFADRSIDLVIGLEMLEHVEDPVAALAEFARVCRGCVVLSVPREPIWRLGNMARGRYLGQLGNTPGHLNHWSAKAFISFVSREFEVLDVAKPLPWTMLRAVPRR